ncbi:MAG TPA: class I SAM-dependent methyltransferase [Terriglobia bacterium]|nr:class I SAM-dependent methyltransferase [Terriglobia bacterium]
MKTIPDPSRDMDEKSWWDLWNRSYRAKDNNDAVSGELFERAAGVANAMTRTQGGRVLEVACGAGALSRLLTYSTYHGLDISGAAIEIARQRAESIQQLTGASPPRYEVADFHDWPLPPGPFDLVVCVDAIEAFRDQRVAIRKMAQSLGPGARLLLVAINQFVYRHIRRTPTSPLQCGPVSHWLSGRELHELVKSAGFAIERSWTIMPRGNCGILRVINSHKLNHAFGPRCAAVLRSLKERVGLGQYRVIVARKRMG